MRCDIVLPPEACAVAWDRIQAAMATCASGLALNNLDNAVAREPAVEPPRLPTTTPAKRKRSINDQGRDYRKAYNAIKAAMRYQTSDPARFIDVLNGVITDCLGTREARAQRAKTPEGLILAGRDETAARMLRQILNSWERIKKCIENCHSGVMESFCAHVLQSCGNSRWFKATKAILYCKTCDVTTEETTHSS